MDKIKIVAIVGSLRKESYNRQLAILAKEYLRDRAEFIIVDYENVPLLNQDYEYPAPIEVSSVRMIVKEADAIWFFVPEYNHFFPGVLKNLMDWLSRPISEHESQVLAKKPAAISGISMGIAGTGIAQDHFVALISFLNMDVMNVPRVTIPSLMQYLDNSGKLDVVNIKSQIEKQADAFVDFVQMRKRI